MCVIQLNQIIITMKKVFLNMFVVAALGMSVISCKNEAKNETEAKEAEEVVEATEE